MLTGISGTLEIKGQGDIKFQVVMDTGTVKESTNQAYWIPDMKCRLFSPQAFFDDNEGSHQGDYNFVIERGSSCIKFGEELDNKLTLQMDPQTKLHQFQAYNSILSAKNTQILKAAVENDKSKKYNFEPETVVQASLQAGPSKL